MIEVDLREFLVNGALGPLRHGLQIDQVSAYCGQPDDRSVSRKAPIWKYGCLELAFRRDRKDHRHSLDFIGLYFREKTFHLPDQFKLTGWWPSPGIAIDAFQENLRDLGVSFSVDHKLSSECHTMLSVGIGVSAYFVFENGSPKVLDSMQYSAREDAINSATSN